MGGLNLKKALKREKVIRRKVELLPEELSIPPELGRIKDKVKVEFQITKEGGKYLLRAKMEGSIILECSRCLKLYEEDLSQNFEVILESYSDLGEEVRLSLRDLNVSFYQDEESVPIEDYIREQIILSVPLKPLCSYDCKGLTEDA